MKKLQKEFAKNVFDRKKMKKYLPRATYKAIVASETTGKSISQKDTERFAQGIKKWALSRGVARYTHLFQPLNNFTAGKRDNLSSVDGEGNAIIKFRGKELQKGESDASSFPSGGIRQTFEARGVTRWDVSSQAFIKDGCLYIPTTFGSFTGEALDKKTPLLRSCAALNKQAVRLLKLVGTSCKKVVSVVGAEQEYFLIDKEKYLARADLVNTGRTLLGAPPCKGQELNDHYYSSPSQKTLSFWAEVDTELWKLGIIVKTEHKEVAPCQFELAPCYAPVHIACDQNQIVMKTLQSVADKFGLVCLLHEKPFDKVNGSGKHNNWSLLTNANENLFEQGETPLEHARFLLLLASVVKAVDEHQDLLHLSVSSAANDCRLGGFEAPPHIISVFLGDHYEKILQTVNNPNFKMGTSLLPKFLETTDRNRTSPFAFTGNKFELRMVGSSASLADCNTVLNTVMADSLQYFADVLEHSQDLWTDAKNLVRTIFARHSKIVFNGNSYSENWLTEASNRKLLNVTSTPQAIKCLSDDKNAALFEVQQVLTARELGAVRQILLENYCNTLTIEANTLTEIAERQVAPAARKFLESLLKTATAKQQLNLDFNQEYALAKKMSTLQKRLAWHAARIRKKLANCKLLNTPLEKAEYICNLIVPAMKQLRQICDRLEQLCPKEMWPFPTYGDLLRD